LAHLDKSWTLSQNRLSYKVLTPSNVVILDNAKSHHDEDAIAMIEAAKNFYSELDLYLIFIYCYTVSSFADSSII